MVPPQKLHNPKVVVKKKKKVKQKNFSESETIVRAAGRESSRGIMAPQKMIYGRRS